MSSILEEAFSCTSTEICLIKYICGGVSLIFVIIYFNALMRVRKRQDTLDLDLKDRILLKIALGESFLILIYHILFSHLIFLFIIRLAKMLEQVTICIILVELTTKKLNLIATFKFALYSCFLCIAIVIAILL